MSIVSDLIVEIDAFLEETGISPTAFGVRALNDGRFVERLRKGANTTIKTVDRVRAYIAAERAKMAAGEDGRPRRRAA